MPDDLFTTGANWMTDQLSAAGATRSITLQDKPTDPEFVIEIEDAVPGSTDWEEDGIDSAAVRTRSRDWIVPVEQLVDGPEPVRPVRGWYVRDSIDDQLYEVYAPGDAAWSYSDTGHRRVRIHTRSLEADQ